MACVLLAGGSLAEPMAQQAEVVAARVPAGETGAESDHLTGNWGGLRDRLVERGVHFSAGYAGEWLANISGGLRRGSVYEGLFELGLDLDTEKLGLWPGGTLHVSGLNPHGTSLSGRYVGDLLTVSNIDAYDSFRLYDFWYDQTLFEGRFSLRFGELLADEEFAGTEPGGHFLNSAFGWPAFISGNTLNTGPAFYAAAPGLRLRYQPADSVFVQAGIYDGDSFDSPVGNPRVNRSGTHLHLSGAQGYFAMAESGYQLNQGEDSKGLPGEYKIGLWMHSGSFESNFEDRNGDPLAATGLGPREHSKNYGVYAAAQQMLWREEGKEGLYGFLRAGNSPADRSLFEAVIDGGFNYQGLVPGREQDILGIGAVYARISRDVRRHEQLDAALNGAVYPGFADHETALECFYSIRLKPWWELKPDFQWIFNPGGAADASDAVVIGVRTTLVF